MTTGHMPWRKIDIWLQGYRSIWLATTRPDGRPHGVPLWFYWDGAAKVVYFAIGGDSVKAKNLTHQSYVVLMAGNADDTIILQGNATLVSDDAERTRVNDQWMKKYVDPYSGATATVTSPDALLYRVDVQHIMAWEYGNIATRTDWKFYDQ